MKNKWKSIVFRRFRGCLNQLKHETPKEKIWQYVSDNQPVCDEEVLAVAKSKVGNRADW